MSTFEDGRFRWRETYFVLFPMEKRPTLKLVQETLRVLNKHYELSNLVADSKGRFESLTLISPDDFAAMDICFTSGVEVVEQLETLVEELRESADVTHHLDLKRLRHYEGRFDVLHFEQVPELREADEDEEEEMLDPGALLAVLGALAEITEGVAIDPQSGTILCNDDE